MVEDKDTWRVWGEDEYGKVLYQRAVGELPEMESSKAAAHIIRNWLQPTDSILDVGCGAGHYLRSLQREIETPFSFTGVDATQAYIDLARKAWQGHQNVRFEIGDIYKLPYESKSYDIVVCCNLLLHLPSIEIPLRELVRMARRKVLVRTLIGERSFRIKDVGSSGDESGIEKLYDEAGEPTQFHYYNIYSDNYIKKLLNENPRVASFQITMDRDYNPDVLAADLATQKAKDTTKVIDGWQVNGYILQPWHFVQIEII